MSRTKPTRKKLLAPLISVSVVAISLLIIIPLIVFYQTPVNQPYVPDDGSTYLIPASKSGLTEYGTTDFRVEYNETLAKHVVVKEGSGKSGKVGVQIDSDNIFTVKANIEYISGDVSDGAIGIGLVDNDGFQVATFWIMGSNIYARYLLSGPVNSTYNLGSYIFSEIGNGTYIFEVSGKLISFGFQPPGFTPPFTRKITISLGYDYDSIEEVIIFYEGTDVSFNVNDLRIYY